MTSEKLLEALTDIDDRFVSEANTATNRRLPWRKIGALAACLCVVAAAIFVPISTREPQGVTIPLETEPTVLDPSVQGRRESYFNYDGGAYFRLTQCEGEELVGRHLGTAVHDDFTPPDGKIDFTGSFSGEIYTVKGFDPEFLLCEYYAPGYPIAIFVRSRGITLEYGRDLTERRMKLSKTLASVSCESFESYRSDCGETSELDSETVAALLDAMGEAKFELYDYDNRTETLYILNFRLENGIEFDFSLTEDGYIRLRGFGAQLKLPQEIVTRLRQSS